MWDLYILNFQTNTTNVVPCYGDAAGTINVSVIPLQDLVLIHIQC